MIGQIIESGFIHDFDFAADCGAKSGLYTLEMERFFDVVYAYEPEEQWFNILKEKVTSAKCHHIGITKNKCRIRFNGRGVPVLHKRGTIRATNIDNLGFLFCDLIRIDCYGYEHEVLFGAMNTIKEFRPFIILKSNDFAEYLLSLFDYKLVITLGEYKGFQCIRK